MPTTTNIDLYSIAIQAATRVSASEWQGRLVGMDDLPEEPRSAIVAILNRLSEDYPSLSSINVEYGDPEWLEDALASKSNKTIYLNKKYWNSKIDFDKVARDWDELRISNDYSGIIVHEIGHILTGQVSEKLGSRKFNNLLEKYLGKGNLNSIPNWVSPSAYGQENVFEFTAEAFASFYLGRHALSTLNDLNLKAVEACRSMWLDFNKVLKGKPSLRKAL